MTTGVEGAFSGNIWRHSSATVFEIAIHVQVHSSCLTVTVVWRFDKCYVIGKASTLKAFGFVLFGIGLQTKFRCGCQFSSASHGD